MEINNIQISLTDGDITNARLEFPHRLALFVPILGQPSHNSERLSHFYGGRRFLMYLCTRLMRFIGNTKYNQQSLFMGK